MKHFIDNNKDFDYNDEEIIKEYGVLKKFKSHNILKERVDLYRDFSINLSYLICDTYLGVEYINNKKDAIGHYNWCFGQLLKQFDDQEIDFYGNDELYNYFLEFYLDQLYRVEKEPSLNYFKRLWMEIFDHKKNNKSKSELDVLVELYQIFDISLDKKNMPLEEQN